MKKIFTIIAITLMTGGLAAANNINLLGFDFIAPVISGASNAPNQTGSIVYDSSTDHFYGNADGTWKTFTASPNSNVLPEITTGSSYAVVGSEDLIMINTGSVFTVNLPTASGNSGYKLVIKHTDSSNSKITVDASSTELIDGSETTILHTENESITLVCDGIGWKVIDRNIPSEWVSVTSPVGSWTTNTTYSGKWRRVGDTMEVQAFITLSGAPNATAFTFDLPSGFTIDTAKLAGGASVEQRLGDVWALSLGGSEGHVGAVRYVDTNTVQPFFFKNNAQGESVASAIEEDQPFTFANGDSIQFTFSVPITDWKN